MSTVTPEVTQTYALPAGYTARPVAPGDGTAVAAMMNQATQAVYGAADVKASDLEAFWTSPTLDRQASTRLVLAPDGAVAGYVDIEAGPPHVQIEHWGQVHPRHVGRGLGSYLVSWVEARAWAELEQAPDGARVSVLGEVNQLDTQAQRLLQDFGYTHVRSNWRMVIDLDPNAPPEAPHWPAGVDVRSFVPGQDDRAALKTIRAAFRDHWGYVERPFEEELEHWQHRWRSDPDFDPSLWFLAVAGEEVICTALCRLSMPSDPEMGWIFSLGVLRSWRRQGVASALLRHCFVELWKRGQRKVGLGVDADSLTNALHLYEAAGMRREPRHTFQVWEKELRPGRELSRRS